MTEEIAENIVAQNPASDEVEAVVPHEPTEHEKRLRREVARYREQARIAESERDAATAAAARDRDEAIATVRTAADQRVIQAELKAAAIHAGIIDLDGLKLANTEVLALNEQGGVEGIEHALSELKASKPYLFSGEKPLTPASTTTSQLQRAPAPAAPQLLDARNLSREAWQAERQRLIASSR
jgi:hypothetical protein